MVDKSARNVDNSDILCKTLIFARFVQESYPHADSEKSMNLTYPQKLWISSPHYPQAVDSRLIFDCETITIINLRFYMRDLSTEIVDKFSTLHEKCG